MQAVRHNVGEYLEVRLNLMRKLASLGADARQSQFRNGDKHHPMNSNAMPKLNPSEHIRQLLWFVALSDLTTLICNASFIMTFPNPQKLSLHTAAASAVSSASSSPTSTVASPIPSGSFGGLMGHAYLRPRRAMSESKDTEKLSLRKDLILADLTNQKDTLQSRLLELQSQGEEAKHQIKKLTDQLESVERQMQTIQASANSAKEQVAAEWEKFDQLADKRAANAIARQSKIEEQKLEIDALLSLLEKRNSIIKEKRKENRELSRINTQLTDQVQRMQSQIDSLKTRLNQATIAKPEVLKQETHEFINSLKEQIDGLMADNGELIKAIKNAEENISTLEKNQKFNQDNYQQTMKEAAKTAWTYQAAMDAMQQEANNHEENMKQFLIKNFFTDKETVPMNVYKTTNQEFQVVRYLPAKDSIALAIYLIYIRPLADMIHRSCFGTNKDRKHLFSSVEDPEKHWKPSRLTAALRKLTKDVTGIEIGVQVYRQLSIAVTERHLAHISKPFNRFDDKHTRQKFDVLNRRVAGAKGKPAQAKSAGLEAVRGGPYIGLFSRSFASSFPRSRFPLPLLLNITTGHRYHLRLLDRGPFLPEGLTVAN